MKPYSGRPYLYQGEWLTIREIAAREGVSKHFVYRRREGNEVRDLKPRPRRRPPSAYYEFDGELLTCAEIMARTGLSQGTVSRRRCGNRVLTDEELAAQPKTHPTATPVFFNGRRMTIPQWSALTGIKAATIYARIVKLGWPVERALTTEARS